MRYIIDHGASYSRKISGSEVTLNSPGGSVLAAMEIGKLMRDNKLPALVDSDKTSLRVRDDKTLPPEILLLGARQSHDVKCFALGHADRS
jgi:hypothetical protein